LPAAFAALFLAAHGLVHASFLSPAPPAKPGSPQWPFDLAHSWLLGPLGLDGAVSRVVGIVLLVVTVAAYAIAALAVIGVTPPAWFAPSVVAGSIVSLAMLALFFHPWLTLGLVIDVVLLWAVLANHWAPGAVG
jgi:hypothetical protein